MTRTWLVAMLGALLLGCGGNGGTPDTVTPMPDTPTPTQPRPVPTVEVAPPPPVVVFVSQATNGTTVQRALVTETGLRFETYPFVLPFAESALSPDGYRLAYAQPDVSDPGMVIVNLDEATQRNIGVSAIEPTRPFWSIDSEYVAARAASGAAAIVWWLHVVSGSDDQTDLGEVRPIDLRWLPDGQGFSFVNDGQAGVFEIGDGYRALTDGPAYEVREVAFAPDRSRAALIRVETPPEPTPTPTAASGETATPAETGTPTAMPETTPTPGDDPEPTPTVAQATWSLVIVGADGQVLAELAPGFRDMARLRWIPALPGMLGFVGTSPDGRAGLWLLEPGYPARLLYEGRVDDATWSHDGRMVAVVADGGACSNRSCPRGFLRVVEMERRVTYRADAHRVLAAPAWELPME